MERTNSTGNDALTKQFLTDCTLLQLIKIYSGTLLKLLTELKIAVHKRFLSVGQEFDKKFLKQARRE